MRCKHLTISMHLQPNGCDDADIFISGIMVRLQRFHRVYEYELDFLHRGGHARVEITPIVMSLNLCVIIVLVLKFNQEVKKYDLFDACDYLSLVVALEPGVTHVTTHSFLGAVGHSAKGT